MPDWIAADLLAQAEHDAGAQAILITDDAEPRRRGRAGGREPARAPAAQGDRRARHGATSARLSWCASLDEALPLVDRDRARASRDRG